MFWGALEKLERRTEIDRTKIHDTQEKKHQRIRN